MSLCVLYEGHGPCSKEWRQKQQLACSTLSLRPNTKAMRKNPVALKILIFLMLQHRCSKMSYQDFWSVRVFTSLYKSFCYQGAYTKSQVYLSSFTPSVELLKTSFHLNQYYPDLYILCGSLYRITAKVLHIQITMKICQVVITNICSEWSQRKNRVVTMRTQWLQQKYTNGQNENTQSGPDKAHWVVTKTQQHTLSGHNKIHLVLTTKYLKWLKYLSQGIQWRPKLLAVEFLSEVWVLTRLHFNHRLNSTSAGQICRILLSLMKPQGNFPSWSSTISSSAEVKCLKMAISRSTLTVTELKTA